MFNRKLSDEYLQRYGHIIKPPFKRNELLKMEKFMAGLTVKHFLFREKRSYKSKVLIPRKFIITSTLNSKNT